MGPITPPLTAASTNNVPIIGPVQENETKENIIYDGLSFGYNFVESFSLPKENIENIKTLINSRRIDLIFCNVINITYCIYYPTANAY